MSQLPLYNEFELRAILAEKYDYKNTNRIDQIIQEVTQSDKPVYINRNKPGRFMGILKITFDHEINKFILLRKGYNSVKQAKEHGF